MSKPHTLRPVHALAAWLVISASASAAEYTIEPIISPDGGYVFTSSIASNGMVVGTVTSSHTYCFKYLDGVFTTLPLPPEAQSCAGAVTDPRGNITLSVVPADGTPSLRSVELTNKGKFIPMNGLSANGNVVMASKGGKMAGHSLSPQGLPQAYLFSRSGKGVNVGALTGASQSWLTGLNAKGWAVGHAAPSPDSDLTRAFVYKDGQVTWLTPLVDGGTSAAVDINDRGVTVGFSESRAGDFMSLRAVAWQAQTTPDNLGTVANWFTYGKAINSSGVIIGRYGYQLNGMRVRRGVMRDLASLLSPEDKAQWSGSLGSAEAINDAGLIAGAYSRYKGIFGVGYLLRPVP